MTEKNTEEFSSEEDKCAAIFEASFVIICFYSIFFSFSTLLFPLSFVFALSIDPYTFIPFHLSFHLFTHSFFILLGCSTSECIFFPPHLTSPLLKKSPKILNRKNKCQLPPSIFIITIIIYFVHYIKIGSMGVLNIK